MSCSLQHDGGEWHCFESELAQQGRIHKSMASFGRAPMLLHGKEGTSVVKSIKLPYLWRSLLPHAGRGK